MIKQFIQKLIGKPNSPRPDFGERHVVPARVHGINVDWVDERALNVVRTLHERGFDAYIVGGKLFGWRPEHIGDNDKITITSSVLAMRGDFVETRNTIYHVQSWYKFK